MNKINLNFRFYLLALVSAINLNSFSQKTGNIKFDNISTRNGLSQSSPNCIMQDSRGLLWIGTEDGLNKYDGYIFTVYKPEVNNLSSISNNRIKCIIEDKEGNLWIGTNGGGLNIYNRESDSFSRFTGFDSTVFKSNVINCLYKGNNSIIWVGTIHGLYKIDPAKKIIKTYINNPFNSNTISNDFVNCIASDKSGYLWIGTEYGLNRLNPDKEIFYWYFNDAYEDNSLSDNVINSIFLDNTSSLWIGTNNGLNLYNNSNDKFERIALPYYQEQNGSKDYIISSLAEDTEGNIWIGTNGKGVYIIYKDIDYILNLSYTPNNPYSLSNNEILSVYKDRSGIMWIGSNGLDKYNPKKEKFVLYNYDPFSAKGTIYRHIHSIYEDDYGILWIGSKSDGIHLLDREHKKSWSISSSENELSSNKIRVIRENPKGIIWVGTDDNGLNKIELNEKREPVKFNSFQYSPVIFNTISSNTIYSLFFDNENSLWIGTDNGISRMNIETGEITRYVPNPADPTSLNNNVAYYIYGDKSGTIWVATDNGINKYDPETDGFLHYVSDENNPYSLSSNELLTFYEDRKGTLWIGTYAKGINSFDREAEKFNRYAEITELATAVVYGIVEDENSNLWLSTNDGIVKFNPDAEPPIRHFTIEDGLQSNEYNGGAYFSSMSGEIFFGGQYGFNCFFPDKVSIDTIAPKIILTEIKINNHVIFPGDDSPVQSHISEVKEIVLRSFENNLSLSFAALHFANPSGNKYKYMLEGFDTEWIDAGNFRSVSYTSLPYRTYTFRVIASNSDDVWNETGISLKIKIRPPFYFTTGFRLLIILLIGFGIYLFIKNRMDREKRQKEKFQKEIEKFTLELEDAKLQLEKQREEITIQKQEIKLREKEQQDIMWFNEGLNKFSDLMSKNKSDLVKLTKTTVKHLIEYVEAEQGGIFLLNDENPEEVVLELTGSYAYNEVRMNSRFLPGEGYIGTCFKEKNVIELDNPLKNYTSVKSGLGEEIPRYIVFVPVQMDESVVGVIEIASFKKLKGYKISFIQKMSETLHSIIVNIQSTEKMLKMVERSQLQSEELIAQEEILKQNLEEMAETQQESLQREDFLVAQAEEYASNEVVLQEEIERLKAEIREIKNISAGLDKKNKKI